MEQIFLHKSNSQITLHDYICALDRIEGTPNRITKLPQACSIEQAQQIIKYFRQDGPDTGKV